MQYVDFGKRSGLKVGRVSLGAMRFGTDPDNAVKVVRNVIDNGVNYIDTCPIYCGSKSEELLGLALKDGYREKVILSSKWSFPDNLEPGRKACDEVRRVIDQSLERLQTDYLDYFQFWQVGSLERFEQMFKSDANLGAVEKAIDEGIVKRTGITGHPSPGVFPKMFENEMFELCTISYSYFDRSMEADIQKLADMGVGVVVMNPAGGGMLVEDSDILRSLLPDDDMPLIEMAYRFVLGTPGVATIIAGMDNPEHALQDTLVGETGELSAEQRATLEGNMAKLNIAKDKLCTACNYCKDCPQDIRISFIFTQYNKFKIFGMKEHSRGPYKNYIQDTHWIKGASPENCSECGKCEAICPNHIPVIQQLKDAHAALRP